MPVLVSSLYYASSQSSYDRVGPKQAMAPHAARGRQALCGINSDTYLRLTVPSKSLHKANPSLPLHRS